MAYTGKGSTGVNRAMDVRAYPQLSLYETRWLGVVSPFAAPLRYA